MPKLFNELKTRYATREGGYTRVLRTEPKKKDQAPSAVLELVDGPRDMRFAATAATVARDRALGREHNVLTRRNIAKCLRYRPDGEAAFEAMVARTAALNLAEPGQDMAAASTDYWSNYKETEEVWKDIGSMLKKPGPRPRELWTKNDERGRPALKTEQPVISVGEWRERVKGAKKAEARR
jgi:hypothetical protein